MLKFVSAYLALSYLAFSTLVAAGVLQTVAAWRLLAGLALLDYRRRPAWRHALGPALIVLGYAWFFGTRRELLTPGPAGAELTILFGSGVALALAATLAGAALLRPLRQRPAAAWPGSVQARQVRLPQGRQATLVTGPQQARPGPGICLLADPATGPGQLASLAARLAGQGCTVLLVEWDAALQRYPDALALMPAAMAYLCQQPLVDAAKLVAGGAGLGADLALRAAAEDRSIVAVVALAPLWEPASARPGLGLLAELSYPEALRWCLGQRRRRLLAQLGSADAAQRIATRPVLVVYGQADALVPLDEAQARLSASSTIELHVVPGEGHVSLAASPVAGELVAGWLRRTL